MVFIISDFLNCIQEQTRIVLTELENKQSTVELHTVQLTSKLTLACGNTRVVFYFCRVTRTKLVCDTRVDFRVEHVSSILCTTRDPSSCAAQL